jgi:aminopeptidase N
MTARVMCSTHQLHLNSVGLALSVLSLTVNGSPRPLPLLTLQPELQLASVAAAAQFSAGDIVTLTLSFSGALSQVNTGLYIASAKVPPYYVIASHFEPTDARRAWPCMDEPAFKAVFNISVVKPADAPIVLSNLPLSARSGPSARELWSFAPAGAVAMSTYLVTIVIGNFSCTTAILPPPSAGLLPPGVQTPVIRVYTVPGAQSQAAVALHTARASIDRMTTLLTSSFPLPKLDLVAIPDYPSGATEHWGLITFRETTLLLDEAASSRDIERVATVVAHEVAHSWFGNLVTMPWWTELWLNEGFASFWEYEGVQAAYAGWGLWGVMPVADTQRAMSIDLLTSALPLIQSSVRSGSLPHSLHPSTTSTSATSFSLLFRRQRNARHFQRHYVQQGCCRRAHVVSGARGPPSESCAEQLVLPQGHCRIPSEVCVWNRKHQGSG